MGSTALLFFVSLVDGRVQRGVVVHFELPIGSVLLSARKQVIEQLLQRQGEVAVLLFAQSDSVGHFIEMLRIRVVALKLFAVVIKPQGHDRQSVDRTAGSLCIDLGVFVPLNASLSEEPRNRIIDLFDHVVAGLVQFVDFAFDVRYFLGRGPGTSSDVLFMPQPIVALMLLADQFVDSIVVIINRLLMPTHNGHDLELCQIVCRRK